MIVRKADLTEYTNEYNKAALDEDTMKEYAKQKTALVAQNKLWMTVRPRSPYQHNAAQYSVLAMPCVDSVARFLCSSCAESCRR